MLSLEELLNPVKAEPRNLRDPSNSPSLACPGSLARNNVPRLTQVDSKKPKMVKDGAIFAKGKIKGVVNFPPFQDLDAEATRQAQMHQVHPLGEIEEYPRHIPYNSEKKSFLEKTGRESFEGKDLRHFFQYEFNGPRDNKVYTVMWDYNIGLVRITPFFKCLHYSKTMPAKMLNLNPGLKEITHSITGGALAAQGYWMPYTCAFAVCATFCDEISGALIPLFGPTFPSSCTSKDSTSFPRMIIDASIITAGTAEAQVFRAQYFSATPSGQTSPTPSFATPPPRSTIRHDINRRSPYMSRRLGLKRTFANGSPSNAGSDTENDSRASSGDRYLHSPFTPASTTSPPITHTNTWTPANSNRLDSPSAAVTTRSLRTALPDGPRRHGHKAALSCGPSPWLSAIPRSSYTAASSAFEPADEWVSVSKPRADEVDDDGYDGYDGEVSASESEKSVDHDEHGRKAGPGENEMRAAWVLMQLSVRDRGFVAPPPPDAPRAASPGPQVKRRRAPLL